MRAGSASDIAASFEDAAASYEGLDQLRSSSSQDLDARVIVSAAGIYVLMMLGFWLAFAGPADVFQSQVTGTIVLGMFAGVPAVLGVMRRRFLARIGLSAGAASVYRPPARERLLRTATGWLPMAEAELLVLSIPVALCAAAVLIGLAFTIVRQAG